MKYVWVIGLCWMVNIQMKSIFPDSSSQQTRLKHSKCLTYSCYCTCRQQCYIVLVRCDNSIMLRCVYCYLHCVYCDYCCPSEYSWDCRDKLLIIDNSSFLLGFERTFFSALHDIETFLTYAKWFIPHVFGIRVWLSYFDLKFSIPSPSKFKISHCNMWFSWKSPIFCNLRSTKVVHWIEKTRAANPMLKSISPNKQWVSPFWIIWMTVG